jgi:hypothetical protein
MIEIDYLFSIGHRCSSLDFLIHHNLRKMSGPFDFVGLDIETAFDNIETKFTKFLQNLVILNLNHKKVFFQNFSKYCYIEKKLLKLKNLNYMRDNYNFRNVAINHNYMPTIINENIYTWDRYCIFLHYNMLNPAALTKIQNKFTIFNKIYAQKSEKTCLIYNSKILKNENIQNTINFIKNLKYKYNIKSYLIIFLCCEDLINEYSIFENEILFIIKKVNSYEAQYKKYGTDMDIFLNTNDDLSLIQKHFSFNLKNNKQIKKEFLY